MTLTAWTVKDLARRLREDAHWIGPAEPETGDLEREAAEALDELAALLVKPREG